MLATSLDVETAILDALRAVLPVVADLAMIDLFYRGGPYREFGMSDDEIHAEQANLHLRLKRIVDSMPQIGAILVVGREGRPLVTSTRWFSSSKWMVCILVRRSDETFFQESPASVLRNKPVRAASQTSPMSTFFRVTDCGPLMVSVYGPPASKGPNRAIHLPCASATAVVRRAGTK